MHGFCDFMKHKTSEKLDSAQKTYDYLILRDEKLIFSKIEEPSIDWINVSDVFNSALSHEEFMLSQIKELYNDLISGKLKNDFIKENCSSRGKNSFLEELKELQTKNNLKPHEVIAVRKELDDLTDQSIPTPPKPKPIRREIRLGDDVYVSRYDQYGNVIDDEFVTVEGLIELTFASETGIINSWIYISGK